MMGPLELMYAFFLDLSIGDPRWAPHPVRIMGTAISGTERFLRRYFMTPTGEQWGGVFLVLFITLPTYFISDRIVTVVSGASDRLPVILGTVVIVYLAATTIATRELVRSARIVITSVKKRDLASARRDVSMIVGRDTHELSDKGVLRATIETLAENLSDGVIAPLFYLAVGGLPLAMTYKAINTLDSMVGYKNERYLHFGCAAARLDDVANYLPARVTGFIIVLSVFLVSLAKNDIKSLSTARRAYGIMIRDGRKHPSPNSGIPEASMAGALGVRLGGPSAYGGVLCDKPHIGEEDEDRVDYLSASCDAVTLVKVSAAVAAILAVSISALGNLQ